MRSDAGRWPLERVLDAVGFVLAATVVIRGTGGLMAGVGVSSFHVDLGATSGSGIVVNNGLPLPTSVRLEYGTSWADMASGLALLGAVGLIALPRMLWDLPRARRRSALPAKSMIGICVLAVLTAVSGLIGTVNWAWNVNRLAGPAEAIDIASGVAAIALAVLCAVLSWFALPYVLTAERAAEHSADRGSDQGG